MGKNLKGKEIGKGICQKADGMYVARFVNKRGKRIEKRFKTLPEAKNWLEESRYQDSHSDAVILQDITVDEWFQYWIENIVCHLAPNTIRNYRDRYLKDASPILGGLKLCDVKQMHCQLIFKRMESEQYSGGTMKQTYIVLGTLFKAAVLNDMIPKNPLDNVRTTKPAKAVDDINFLTIQEQRKFLEVAKDTHNYYQYAFLLETGLRTGELVGLTWDCIDLENRLLTVRKTLEYRHSVGCWRAGPPKSKSGYRTIPLTNRAVEILEILHAQLESRKEAPELSTVLKFMDTRSGKNESFTMRDLVFVNYRTGMPSKNSSYDTHLERICKIAGIKHISMHTLRHTYATRAIERNVNPKVLQRLLGHSTVQQTMDRYVHVSNESLQEAVQKFEQGA